LKIVSIIGARPEFVQSFPVSRALRPRHQEILVHTGQHYDLRMSQVFFDELGIAAPEYNLGVGSAPHGRQLAAMLIGLEEILERETPDLVMVRGDTNSTMAGALTAAKLHIRTAHVEAGERSFDRRMPEEINRLVADSVSDLLFCASQQGVTNLASEGMLDHVFWIGDVTLDALDTFLPLALDRSPILDHLRLGKGQYALVTVHRAGNTDDRRRLDHITKALDKVAEQVVFPVHPRTRTALNQLAWEPPSHVQLIEPVSYFDMLTLEANARLIATDSGGVQREAYYLGIPCLTLRDETEWVATVAAGWNRLVGIREEIILNAWREFAPPVSRPQIYGDGHAAERLAEILQREVEQRDLQFHSVMTEASVRT
jgi:UDP-GlcNAc3NAcA epimerase